MRDVWISRLGQALPGRAIRQAEVVEWLEPRLHIDSDKQRFQRFAGRCGVEVRHSVLDLLGEEGRAFYPAAGDIPPDMMQRSQAFAAKALPLAMSAIHRACPDGLGEITHIVVTTCTGAVAPGLDVGIIRALKLRSDIRRTMISFMGCYAAIPALRAAWSTCRADPQARVLVVCCELSTLHLQPGPADDQLIATLLFGDGATAAVIESADSPPGVGLRLVRDASALAADSEDQMSWLAGSDGFVLRISSRVSVALANELVPLARRLLGAGREPAEVRWAVHPGGPRILAMVENSFNLPATGLLSSRAELAHGGNRSSATVLAILDRELRQEWRGEIALIAFGPGLTADAISLERCA